jgi:hypothetical protein
MRRIERRERKIFSTFTWPPQRFGTRTGMPIAIGDSVGRGIDGVDPEF